MFDHAHPFDVGRMEIRRLWRRADGTTTEEQPADQEDGNEPMVVLRGYAAKYNVLSEMMWDFQETIAPGAFDSVMGDDVRALFNHDPNHILGRTVSSTLRISLDDVGLIYEVDLPDTSLAETVACAVERGDVTQSSFAFIVNEATWTEREDGTWLRTITSLKRLYDVSPVTYPAYPDATVGLRSAMVKEQRQLRDATLLKEREQSGAAAIANAAEVRRRQLKLIGA